MLVFAICLEVATCDFLVTSFEAMTLAVPTICLKVATCDFFVTSFEVATFDFPTTLFEVVAVFTIFSEPATYFGVTVGFTT